MAKQKFRFNLIPETTPNTTFDKSPAEDQPDYDSTKHNWLLVLITDKGYQAAVGRALV